MIRTFILLWPPTSQTHCDTQNQLALYLQYRHTHYFRSRLLLRMRQDACVKREHDWSDFPRDFWRVEAAANGDAIKPSGCGCKLTFKLAKALVALSVASATFSLLRLLLSSPFLLENLQKWFVRLCIAAVLHFFLPTAARVHIHPCWTSRRANRQCLLGAVLSGTRHPA